MPVTTADAQLRDRLKAIREDLKAKRSERVEAKKEVDAAKEAFAGADSSGQKITEMAEFQAAEDAVRKHGEIGDQIADLELAESSILKMMGADESANGRSANPALESGSPMGWNGHRLLAESDQYQAAVERGVFRSTGRFGVVELGEIADRDQAIGFLARPGAAALPAAPAGDIGTPAGVPPDYRGIIPPRLIPLNLLDLIPTGTTDSNVVNYVQVTAIPQGAAETAELALKPELGLTTQDATAPVRTIAGYVKVARQALDDMAGLATLINTLLPHEVRRRIMAQILSGDGAGQNLLGIMNTTGIGAPAAVAGDNAADAILRAVTTIVLSDSDPNFVTLNPVDWQNLLLMRAGAQDGSWSGQYLYGGPGMLHAPTIWGLTITQNRIVPAGQSLIGDAMGAALLVREGVNIKTSDSDQDDFVRNRVTILAEARVALPVWRPSAFAVVTLP